MLLLLLLWWWRWMRWMRWMRWSRWSRRLPLGARVVEVRRKVGGGRAHRAVGVGAERVPHRLLPRLEVLLQVRVVVALAQLEDALAAQLAQPRVGPPAHVVEVLVLPVAQPEDGELQRRELFRLLALLQRGVEHHRVVRRLALAVRRHQEDHRPLLVAEVVHLVVLEVDRLGRVAALLRLAHQRRAETLRRARLRAPQDRQLAARVRVGLLRGRLGALRLLRLRRAAAAAAAVQ